MKAQSRTQLNENRKIDDNIFLFPVSSSVGFYWVHWGNNIFFFAGACEDKACEHKSIECGSYAGHSISVLLVMLNCEQTNKKITAKKRRKRREKKLECGKTNIKAREAWNAQNQHLLGVQAASKETRIFFFCPAISALFFRSGSICILATFF